MKRKGIVMAGGKGTRLAPATNALCKQLLPVYDKPLVYYPLSVLMLGGIREILIITSPRDLPTFKELLGDGSRWGVEFQFAAQESPAGIAQAFTIGAEFLAGAPAALILGDNIFHGHKLADLLRSADARQTGATVFAYRVSDPSSYGVVTFDEALKVQRVDEKPQSPQSKFAITGLYYYDERVVELASRLAPSPRGELEITDLNRVYLSTGDLHVIPLGAGFTWLDAGTHESLLDAANFTRITEDRQGLKICCPEEVAWRLGYIGDHDLSNLAEPLKGSGYGSYLLNLLSTDRLQ